MKAELCDRLRKHGLIKRSRSLKLDGGKPYFLASAFMSQTQEVRLLMRPLT